MIKAICARGPVTNISIWLLFSAARHRIYGPTWNQCTAALKNALLPDNTLPALTGRKLGDKFYRALREVKKIKSGHRIADSASLFLNPPPLSVPTHPAVEIKCSISTTAPTLCAFFLH